MFTTITAAPPAATAAADAAAAVFLWCCDSVPSAVGLSFSLNRSDYTTNDTQVARDSHAVLRGIFARHAELQKNDFYISG